MLRVRRLAALGAALVLAAVAAGGAGALPAGSHGAAATAANGKLKVPAWIVTGKAVDAEKAKLLSEALGTFDVGLQENGSIMYVDPDRFLALPTLPQEDGKGEDEDGNPTDAEALDLEAIAQLDVLDQQQAVELAEAALADAELDPLNGTRNITRTPVASHSMFDAAIPGMDVMRVPIDTQVDYELRLGRKQIPLIGPGANVKIAFDGEEHATTVQYSLWSMRQGQNVVIVPPRTAVKQALVAYRNQCSTPPLGRLKLDTQLAYYAPPLDAPARRIMPVYRIGGTALTGDQSVQLRELLLPAVQVGAPKASLQMVAKGRTVQARAVVRGGTPPYTYRWESCTSVLDPQPSGAEIEYAAGGREAARLETLLVHVTDANGMTTSARKSVQLARAFRRTRPFRLASLGRLDVGASTVGTSQGLPGCLPDTAGFVNRMAFSGVPAQFHWTNSNAWESDFKDPAFAGGQDSSYADDVDAVFYCGHANGDGFTFPTNHTDTFLGFGDARWGNRDLEWLGIAACGPLQDSSSGLFWWQRWGPAFRGLHLLAGYETTSFDVTGEGFEFAHNMLGGFWWGGAMTVRQAWVSMAISQQPSSVRWAVMGAFGPGGVSNWNDYFWGMGPTGPDIVSPTGWWKISGAA
jgi:hypothetical protein